jgi:hypothetical protein
MTHDAPAKRKPAEPSELTELRKMFEKRFHLVPHHEGWFMTNDADYQLVIARIDCPDDWIDDEQNTLLDFTEPKFQHDDEAIAHVRTAAAAGSRMHQIAIQLHDAKIPYSRRR